MADNKVSASAENHNSEKQYLNQNRETAVQQKQISQLMMAPNTTDEMETKRISQPKPTAKEKMENYVCGNCGIKGHTLEICEGPLVDGFLDACPICNTNKHNLILCRKPLSAIHAVRIQLYCRARRPPIVMPFDPWQVDRRAFINMWQTGRLCLSKALADEIWKKNGCPSGIMDINEGDRQKDPQWDFLKKTSLTSKMDLPDEWFFSQVGRQFSRPKNYPRWSEEEILKKLGLEKKSTEPQDEKRYSTSLSDKDVGVTLVGESNKDFEEIATTGPPHNVNDLSENNNEAAVSFTDPSQKANKPEANKEQATASRTVVIENSKLDKALELVAKVNELGIDLDNLQEAFSIVEGAASLGLDIDELYTAAKKRVREESPSAENPRLPKKQRPFENDDEEHDHSANIQVSRESENHEEGGSQNLQVPRQRETPDGGEELISPLSPLDSSGLSPRNSNHQHSPRAKSIDSRNPGEIEYKQIHAYTPQPANYSDSPNVSNYNDQTKFQNTTVVQGGNRFTDTPYGPYDPYDYADGQTGYSHNEFSETFPQSSGNGSGNDNSFSEGFALANNLTPSFNPTPRPSQNEFSRQLPQTNNNSSNAVYQPISHPLNIPTGPNYSQSNTPYLPPHPNNELQPPLQTKQHKPAMANSQNHPQNRVQLQRWNKVRKELQQVEQEIQQHQQQQGGGAQGSRVAPIFIPNRGQSQNQNHQNSQNLQSGQTNRGGNRGGNRGSNRGSNRGGYQGGGQGGHQIQNSQSQQASQGNQGGHRTDNQSHQGSYQGGNQVQATQQQNINTRPGSHRGFHFGRRGGQRFSSKTPQKNGKN